MSQHLDDDVVDTVKMNKSNPYTFICKRIKNTNICFIIPRKKNFSTLFCPLKLKKKTAKRVQSIIEVIYGNKKRVH